MKKLFLFVALFGVLNIGCTDMLDEWKDFVDGDTNTIIANNEIWYTNGSAKVKTNISNEQAFNVGIVSNKYSKRNNCWVIKFDGELKSIGELAFKDSNLKSVTIPSGVTSVESGAFANCRSLSEFNSEFASDDGRCLIVDGRLVAFAPAGVAEYTISEDVTEIGDLVFSSCNYLSRVTCPNSVISIGESAFAYCANLTHIAFSNKLATIGSGAFSNCHSLIEVMLPYSVDYIGDFAFSDCSAISSLTIPNGVISIGNRAFLFCNSLTEVNIPDSVTTLGSSIFEGCGQLKSVTLGKGITAIPKYAFYKCDKLESVILGDRVTIIGELAFNCCLNLTTITLPESVTTIGVRAFGACLNLVRVYCKAITPPILVMSDDGCDVFTDNMMERLIYVPYESVQAYKSADGWMDYSDAIVGYNF